MLLLNQLTFQHQSIQLRELRQDLLKLIQHQLQLHQERMLLQLKRLPPQLHQQRKPLHQQKKPLHQQRKPLHLLLLLRMPHQPKMLQQRMLKPRKVHQRNNQDLNLRKETKRQSKLLLMKSQLMLQRKQQKRKVHHHAQQDKFATNMTPKQFITRNHSMELVLMKTESVIKMLQLNQSMFQHQSIQLLTPQPSLLKLIQHQQLQQKMLSQQLQLRMPQPQPKKLLRLKLNQLKPPFQRILHHQSQPLQKRKKLHKVTNQDLKLRKEKAKWLQKKLQ